MKPFDIYFIIDFKSHMLQNFTNDWITFKEKYRQNDVTNSKYIITLLYGIIDQRGIIGQLQPHPKFFQEVEILIPLSVYLCVTACSILLPKKKV